MNIPIIPNNIDKSFSVVNTLSPSVFTQLKNGCLYQKILQDSISDKTKGLGVSLTFPPNPAALYGSIIHRLYEKRMKGLIPDAESFERMWDAEVKKVNETYSPRYPLFVLKNDYDKMFESQNVAMGMQPVTTSMGSVSRVSSSSQFERSYKIPGKLHGIIDRISCKDSYVEIIDYKTGMVYDDSGKIKQIYIDQLNLYALMYEATEGKKVSKLTIIDKNANEIDVPILPNKENLLDDVDRIIRCINDSINNGTAKNLATPSEENCKYCNCRHLCEAYWKSSYLPNDFVKGVISNNGTNFVDLTNEEDGTHYRVSSIEKLNISSTEFYIGRRLMFLSVFPSQQTIGHFLVTKNTLVFEYPSDSDPNSIYYSNYLPELHPFIKVTLDKGIHISSDGGYYLLDNDDTVIAEAGLGIDSLRIVVNADDVSQKVFEGKGFKVFSLSDINEFTNFLNNC